MHKSHGKSDCDKCQVCGTTEAKLVCTYVVNDKGNKETDCWCVCDECRDKLEKGVHDFYKEMISDMEHGEQNNHKKCFKV